MKKINKWFAEVFLESFESGRYNAQDSWLKKWQYKGLMELAERNHWKMLSPKQWDVFRRNVNFQSATYEDFANFETDTKRVSIRISKATGFVTIDIIEKEKPLD